MSNAKDQRGLYEKYKLVKADGSPVDPRGVYFILKLNSANKDNRRASRAALRAYADTTENAQLQHDLRKLLKRMGEES